MLFDIDYFSRFNACASQHSMNIRVFSFVTILGLVVLIGHAPAVAWAQTTVFADVIGTPYEYPFSYLLHRDIVTGTNGLAKPNNFINRAEAVVAVLRGSSRSGTSHDIQAERYIDLWDVPEHAWFGPLVRQATAQGLVQGYADGSFHPQQLITTEEAVTLLLRAYNIEIQPSQTLFSANIQNRAGEWFSPYISAAIRYNLASDQDTLHLGAPVTRGQFFSLLYRLDTVQQTGQVAFVDIAKLINNEESRLFNKGTNSQQYASAMPFALTVPGADLFDVPITHPSDALTEEGIIAVLQYGIGHLFSYPGKGEKILLYGHSSSRATDVSQFTKIFRQIHRLKKGDLLYVTYDGVLFVYEVFGNSTVSAHDVSYLRSNGPGEELILYTCWPPFTTEKRYVVYAKPLQKIHLVSATTD